MIGNRFFKNFVGLEINHTQQHLKEVEQKVEGAEGGVGDPAGAQHHHVQARLHLQTILVKITELKETSFDH